MLDIHECGGATFVNLGIYRSGVSRQMLADEVKLKVRDALFAQKYNLLLGAGTSLDSRSELGTALLGTDALRRKLCALVGARDDSPLSRVAGLLTPAQVEEEITRRFEKCIAGPTLRALTGFSWKQAYTLNVDDALEDAYATEAARLQDAISINYKRTYETFRNPQMLPIVHLHGFVGEPDDGYVFSLQEYAGLQQNINPWVHSLSNLIVSEPFVIAGTSLFEPDLEYFLAHRPSKSDVLSRAPSILIEPRPDAVTKRDCERLGLILVPDTLENFLRWARNEFGDPPSPLALREPPRYPRVLGTVSVHTRTAFWNDFDFIHKAERDSDSKTPSPFVFGRAPSWEELHERRDVPLQSQLSVIDRIRKWEGTNETNPTICLSGLAGSGKSTTVRRVALEVASHGVQAFFLRARDGIDIDSAAKYLATVIDPILLVTDSLAENGDQLLAIVGSLDPKKRIGILGAERAYRMKRVAELFEPSQLHVFEIQKWRLEELTELISRYTAMGLVGNAGAVKDPRGFAKEIAGDIAAEAVCRILNDFRPLKVIARSLWNDLEKAERSAYISVALAQYCHPAGVKKAVAFSMFQMSLVAEMGVPEAPLRIVGHPDDDSFLISANAILGKLLVEEMANQKPDRLVQIAANLANAIAPFVTRQTIRQRTAEARLAHRLFDADGVLPDLLGPDFDPFYELTNEKWRWNSRYWEQRALFVSRDDTALAIQYARNAIAIERHPFPMTTLAHVLFGAAADASSPRREYFNEALELMVEALRKESEWERGRTWKGFRTFLDGCAKFLRSGGKAGLRQRREIENGANDALREFFHDSELKSRAQEVLELLNSTPAD